MTRKYRVKDALPYSPPLDRLLTLGRPGGPARGSAWDTWREAPIADYAGMGIGREHVPELIRMAGDVALHQSTDDRYFGSVHACRALVALGAVDAVPAMITVARRACNACDDYWCEDLERLLATFGEKALDHLARAVRDQRETFGARITICAALERMVKVDPNVRTRVIGIMNEVLAYARFSDPGINGFVVEALVDLYAVDSMPLIRKAYEMNRVVDSGSLESVEARMRMTPEEREAELEAIRQKWSKWESKDFLEGPEGDAEDDIYERLRESPHFDIPGH